MDLRSSVNAKPALGVSSSGVSSSEVVFRTLLNELPQRDNLWRVALALSAELSKDGDANVRIEIAKTVVSIVHESSLLASEAVDLKRLADVNSKLVAFATSILAKNKDLSIWRKLAELSDVCGPVRLALGRAVLSNIQNAVIASKPDRHGQGITSMEAEMAWASLNAPNPISDVCTEELGIEACLNFLPLMHAKAQQLDSDFLPGFSSSLMLIADSDRRVSSLAKETTLTLLSLASHVVNPAEILQEASPLIWNVLQDLGSYSKDRTFQESSQSILLRMLSLPNLNLPHRSVLYKEEYWKLLHETLRTGTYEGQKFCLAVVGLSLSRVDQDFDNRFHSFQTSKASLVNAHLTKFCIIYQTVVLGRYLNQVEQCLPELYQLTSYTSPLHKAWIVSLFYAALGNGMQDSIRKLMGRWMLENGVAMLQHVPSSVPGFLENILLPWAAEGQHFTSKNEVDKSGNPVCTHGEKMSHFVSRVIAEMQSPDDQDAIIRAVLRYLVRSTPRAYSFPRAYILDGLLQALQSTSITLKPDMVADVESLSTASHFHELSNDLMKFICRDILTFAQPSGSKLSCLLEESCSNLARLPLDKDAQASYESAIEFFSFIKNADGRLNQLSAYIKDSPQTALKGHGMQAACDFLNFTLSHNHVDEDAGKQLLAIINALWEEVEIQDYPRYVMMQIPGLVLHPRCIRLSLANKGLRQTLFNISKTIQSFSETRVWLFHPLAKALRTAVLDPTLPACEELFPQSLITYVNQPPATKTEFHLLSVLALKLREYIPFRTYEFYYGASAGHGHGVMLDILNTLPQKYIPYAMPAVDELLDRWVKQKLPPPVFSPWKKTTQIQATLILTEHAASTMTPHEIDLYFQKLFSIIAVEPLPILRYLFEWVIVRLCQATRRQYQMLDMLAKADISNPKFVVSILKVSLDLACATEATEDYGYSLMLQLFNQCAGSKIAIRHEAQWSVPKLWDHAVRHNWRKVLDNPAFARLNDFIRDMEAFKHPPAGRLLEAFNVTNHHNLTHLVEGQYLGMEPAEVPRLRHEHLASAVATRGQAILDQTEHGDRQGILPIGTKPISTVEALAEAVSTIRAPGSTFSVSVPLQVKSQQFTDLMSLDGEPALASRKHPITLLATFVDNAFNLGGLSRLSEIFGLSSMLIKSSKLLSMKDFQSVSVNSEKHLPIEQLATDDVVTYLRTKKTEGYTIVGIEQTDSSRVLGDESWKFEERVVLIPGSEKYGIPAHVLQECDYCVVVKQIGVTRSMNVQTATAVVVYEYIRQRSR